MSREGAPLRRTPATSAASGERTTLSWDRTALAAGGLAALLVRTGLADRRPLEIVAAVVAILDAGVIAASGRARQSADAARLPRVAAAVSALTALTIALALAGALLG